MSFKLCAEWMCSGCDFQNVKVNGSHALLSALKLLKQINQQLHAQTTEAKTWGIHAYIAQNTETACVWLSQLL